MKDHHYHQAEWVRLGRGLTFPISLINECPSQKSPGRGMHTPGLRHSIAVFTNAAAEVAEFGSHPRPSTL
jgi:hypothetical protein